MVRGILVCEIHIIANECFMKLKALFALDLCWRCSIASEQKATMGCSQGHGIERYKKYLQKCRPCQRKFCGER